MEITKKSIEERTDRWLSKRVTTIDVLYVQQYNELHTQNGMDYSIYPSENN